MEEKYTISLADLVKEFQFEIVHRPDHFEDILITTAEVSRPGLALSGYFGVFEPWRIQLIGNAERKYLLSLPEDERRERIVNLIEARPAAILITTNNPVFEEMLEAAKRVGVPILRTASKTSSVMSALIASLNLHLAPRITRHGVLVEVYGEGLLIIGESGVPGLHLGDMADRIGGCAETEPFIGIVTDENIDIVVVSGLIHRILVLRNDIAVNQRPCTSRHREATAKRPWFKSPHLSDG